MLALFGPFPRTSCTFGCCTNLSSASGSAGTGHQQIQIADGLFAHAAGFLPESLSPRPELRLRYSINSSATP